MISTKLYLDTRRARKDGTFPVKIVVNRNGNFLVSTGLYATPAGWAGSEFSSKALDARPKNIRLRKMLNTIENLILELDEKNCLHSTSNAELKRMIESRLDGSGSAEPSFFECLDKFVALKTNPGTQTRYRQTKKSIAAFDANPRLSTITPEWLLRYQKHLTDKGFKTNSIASSFKCIRAVFNFAITNNYTTFYPFKHFKIKMGETEKKALTPEQFAALRDFPCRPVLQKYRDMFLLSFYLIGINPADLYRLTEIKNGRIEYARCKTGRKYSIKVEPEALEIIERYRGADRLIAFSDAEAHSMRVLTNASLKKIGTTETVNGEKVFKPLIPGLTNYHARHTWATIAYDIGIPIETISQALGHSYGSPITAVYIRKDIRKVDEANRKVIDFVNSVKSE